MLNVREMRGNEKGKTVLHVKYPMLKVYGEMRNEK
jgi:hypothetical protein